MKLFLETEVMVTVYGREEWEESDWHWGIMKPYPAFIFLGAIEVREEVSLFVEGFCRKLLILRLPFSFCASCLSFDSWIKSEYLQGSLKSKRADC